ncbi:uncharacterized protein LOC106881883 [Octopus bimaculoides]|uniref:Uncharacterized protein n=1 Tax=Octopus bimaculoides TaxID=37653 RepID=A0A0L8FQA5_OCTBM|nr:uncharacterized protein LOC106881883 [Octopus bimaculoides]|eukprot:XP_014787891.1 PREDICTED: uncharacterized protein LOC106881883 [Octopus bimaculoides]
MKWHDLKSNYMREKRKSRESIRSETSEKFTPSWWLFGLMDSFLGPIYEEKRNSMINNNTIQQVSNQNIMEENEYNWSQEEDTKNFIINLNADKLSYNTGNADCLAQDTHTMFTVEQNAQTAATTSHKSSLPIRRNKLKNLHRMEHNSLETITNNNRLLQELQGSLTPAIEEDPDDIFAKLIGFELKKIRSDILKSELKLEIMSICHKFHIKQREEAAH